MPLTSSNTSDNPFSTQRRTSFSHSTFTTPEDYALQAKPAAAAAEGMQLDPALIDAGRRSLSHSQSQEDGGTDRESWRSEKRTQLMREAEEMRAALRAKEREIDELG